MIPGDPLKTTNPIRPRTLSLSHGDLHLPVFLPDATLGMVRGLDMIDVAQTGISAVMMNVFHLMQKPGTSTIQALGGLHRMSAWAGPIITDSGGFQAYSLIRQNAKFGRLSDKGLSFTPEGGKRKFQLTPEKSIQLQMTYGADILTCLDDCTHVDDPPETQRQSVRRTIAWAKRSRAEFDRQIEQRGLNEIDRPRLFAVIQGGRDEILRRECAEALLEIGFDGFGYGGWPLDSDNQLVEDIVGFTRSLIPASFPMHALGIGHPYHLQTCTGLDYDIFDCALPTRDARRGRLYTFTQNPDTPGFALDGSWFSYLYLQDRKHIKAQGPVFGGCDCYTCRHYSLGYLHHLYKANDTLIYRLATLHNLRFMARLTQLLQ